MVALNSLGDCNKCGNNTERRFKATPSRSMINTCTHVWWFLGTFLDNFINFTLYDIFGGGYWWSHQVAATSATRRIFSRTLPSPTIRLLPYISILFRSRSFQEFRLNLRSRLLSQGFPPIIFCVGILSVQILNDIPATSDAFRRIHIKSTLCNLLYSFKWRCS